MSANIEPGLGSIITLQPKGIKVQVIEGHCDQCYFAPHYPLRCYQMKCAGKNDPKSQSGWWMEPYGLPPISENRMIHKYNGSNICYIKYNSLLLCSLNAYKHETAKKSDPC